MDSPTLQFTISVRRLMKTLWITVGVLIGMHVALMVLHYRFSIGPWYVRQIFDVDQEDSFPTWYSASALLLTSGFLWVNARRLQSSAGAWRWHWHGLALGFLLMSVDEIAGVHETINSLITESWTVPGAIFAALLAGIYLPFLGQLDRRTAIRFALGGAIFVGGAIGVEWLTEPYLKNKELNTLAYNLWNAVEEGMEMSGVLVFLQALLKSMKAGRREFPLEISLAD